MRVFVLPERRTELFLHAFQGMLLRECEAAPSTVQLGEFGGQGVIFSFVIRTVVRQRLALASHHWDRGVRGRRGKATSSMRKHEAHDVDNTSTARVLPQQFVHNRPHQMEIQRLRNWRSRITRRAHEMTRAVRSPSPFSFRARGS